MKPLWMATELKSPFLRKGEGNLDWHIKTLDKRGEGAADRGNTFFTGNGYLGLRGTLDEYTKKQLCAINLAGIYDRHGDGWREPLNAPNALYTTLAVDGQNDVLNGHAPVEHSQELDFRHGLQKRRTVYKMPRGTLTVNSERFASMDDVHLICLKYSVSANFHGEFKIASGIDGNVWDINGPHYTSMEFSLQDEILCAIAITGENGQVAVCEAVELVGTADRNTLAIEKGMLRVIHFTGQKQVSFIKWIGVYTSNDCENPMECAAECVRIAAKTSYEQTYKAHCAQWEQLWKRSAIEIDGDDEAMRALNYSIYHLHCIAPRHAKNLSIAARGLSGQTYKGAVFWDTELFMLDFYLYSEPSVARSLLQYRIEALAGAQKKAAAYGWRGAFYAWESQENGFDACSDYNVTDVFTGRPVRTYFKDKQVHISSAVAYALMKYVDVTGDLSILAEGGAEVILECARFYRSLLVKRVDGNRYEIRDVIGPDEYHERVNNNAYTNHMAQYTLRAAILAADLLQRASVKVYTELEQRLHFKTELRGFEEAADRLYVAQPNEIKLIEQFDGYFALEDTTPAVLSTRLLHEKEYWGGSNGVATHTQVIKQADVVAMLTLFRDSYPKEVHKANWDYYEPRTEHGSSLSACMHAQLACVFGDAERAYPFFMKTATVDLYGKSKQWAGLIYIGGTHPAASGGAWMTAVLGFGGLKIKEGSVWVTPCLPSHWKRLCYSITWQGKLRRIEVTPHGVQISETEN